MTMLVEEWSNGPTERREFKQPGHQRGNGLLELTIITLRSTVIILWHFVLGIVSYLLSVFAKPKSLKDRVCMVTGAGRGLGRALCLALAREGAVVACLDIDQTNNNTTASMIQQMGARAEAYHVNVASRKEIEEAIQQIEDELGPIYLLVNNAAIVLTPIDNTEEFVRATFNVNILGPIWATEALMTRLKARKEGHIVNISSLSASIGMYPIKIYGATKAALTNYSSSTRNDILMQHPDCKIIVTTVIASTINTSQDYLDLVDFKLSMFTKVETAVKRIMTGIKFDKEYIYIPGFFNIINIFFQLFPTRATLEGLRSVANSFKLPSIKHFSNLPAGDWVASSSFMEKSK